MDVKLNKKFSVLTENGFKKFSGIKKTYADETIKFEFSDGSDLECTTNHLLKVNDTFIEAKNLSIGDTVGKLQITNKQHFQETKPVYDLLNVEGGHEYITNNVTSHNCAFVENWDVFYKSVYPTISSGKNTKVVFTSTPNGLNHYYKLWTDAINANNDFIPIKVTWKDVPGRDEAWKQQTISNTSKEAFIQEHEAEFIGSSGTLIEGWKLKELAEWNPIKSNKYTKVYENPEKGSEYVIACDVSRGKGIDNSAFSVIKTSVLPYKVVATYYCGEIPPDMYAEVIYQAHKQYNNAYVIVENNDAGCETLRVLNDTYECDALLGTIQGTQSGDKKRISINGGQGFELGVRTSRSTKAIGCARLKTLIENNSLVFGDKMIIHEANRFSKKGSSYEAEKGEHDDIIMTLVIFAWLTTQDLFSDMTNIDVRKEIRNQFEDRFEEELIPFGYIVNGVDEFQETNADLLGYHVKLPDYSDYYDIMDISDETTNFILP